MAAIQLMGEVFKLGDVISGERRKAGYKTAVEFSEAVERKTGMKIPKDTMQRIEAGRQEPKISQYIAIAITLGKLLDPMLRSSVPAEMLTRSIAIGTLDYENAHPDVQVKSKRWSWDDNYLTLTLSNGADVTISAFGNIWEDDHSNEF